MSKITEAIEKITAEVNRSESEPIQTIGEYLIDTMTEASAEIIMASEKNITGAFAAIASEARKQSNAKSVCISDKRGFEIVDQYYGITPEDRKPGATITAITPAPAQGMNINLMDLL